MVFGKPLEVKSFKGVKNMDLNEKLSAPVILHLNTMLDSASSQVTLSMSTFRTL